MEKDPLPLKNATQRLIVWWIVGVSPSLIAMFIGWQNWWEGQSDVWQWYTPQVYPTLTLMVSSLASAHQQGKTVDRFLYRLACGSSLFYLMMLFLAILMEPGHAPKSGHAIDYFKTTWYYLDILHGFALFTLGYIFTSSSNRNEGANSPNVGSSNVKKGGEQPDPTSLNLDNSGAGVNQAAAPSASNDPTSSDSSGN